MGRCRPGPGVQRSRASAWSCCTCCASVLAPPSTSAGLRRLVLIATPLPEAAEKPETAGRAARTPAIDPTPVTEPPELEGASKRARLAWWYERDAAYGDRSAVAAAAKRLAPLVGLGEGTARAYIGRILAGLRKEGRRHDRSLPRPALLFVFAAVLCSCPSSRPAVREASHLFPGAARVLFRRGAVACARRRPVLQGRARPPRAGPPPGPGAALADPAPAAARRRVRLAGRARVPLGPPGRAAFTAAGSARTWASGPGCSRRRRDYAVRLGRAQYGRRAYARGEDQTLVLAPQRTGKSGLLADRILSHRGPLLATTTRGDLYQITAAARSRLGPVEVFNPQGVAGISSTFAWDMLEPCRDLVMAHRMARWLTGGSDARADHGNLEWFEQKGDVALSALLWAAAVGGYSITDVFRWNQLHGHETALARAGNASGQLTGDAGGRPPGVRAATAPRTASARRSS